MNSAEARANLQREVDAAAHLTGAETRWIPGSYFAAVRMLLKALGDEDKRRGRRADGMGDEPEMPAEAGQPVELDDEAIHGFFGLSYSSYLVLPRTALQSMPPEWQRRFVAMLNEVSEYLGEAVEGGAYWVRRRDPRTGAFVHDPLADYERGRRRLEPKEQVRS